MILDIYENCNSDKGCLGRWERWDKHRQQINKILHQNVFNDRKLKNAIVLGAGRCDDLDLKYLLDNIDTLTLVDYDYKSMELAIERQNLTEEQKEQIILKGNVEFTGFYNSYIIDETMTRFREHANPEQLIEELLKYINGLNNVLQESMDNQKYELAISGAVHSQLIVPFFELIKTNKQLGNQIIPFIGLVANMLAEKYNRDIVGLASSKGSIFSYFDVMELSEKNNTMIYDSLLSGLLAQEEYLKIDEILLRNRGVAGARHGYEHLQDMSKEFVHVENAWIWDYRNDKKYYVKSICTNL